MTHTLPHNIRFIFAVVILTLIGFFPARYDNHTLEPMVPMPLPPPAIEASASLAMDLISGEYVFEKNSEYALPLASLTKIVSALTLLDMLKPNDQVVISKTAIATQGISTLRLGEHIRVEQLLTMAMVESSNDAIMALVEHATKINGINDTDAQAWFLQRMHQKAQSLGAPTMQFFNPTGLDLSPTENGAYGSAKELLAIARASYASPIWRWGSKTEIISRDGIIHRLIPTSTLDRIIPQITGAKTGFTDLAGGNLLVLVEYPIGRPLGIVVLGSSMEGRFSDVETIFSFIKQSIISKNTVQ